MAHYNGDVGTYSHAHFTGLKETFMNRVQAVVSTSTFAHFASRNKILVRAIHTWVRSAFSLTAASLGIQRSGVSIGYITAASMADVGKYHYKALTASNTLHTITEVMNLHYPGDGKGELDVLYEYQVLYPSEYIGS